MAISVTSHNSVLLPETHKGIVVGIDKCQVNVNRVLVKHCKTSQEHHSRSTKTPHTGDTESLD